MATQSSADSGDRSGLRPTGLSAVQELLGAISAGLETETRRVSLPGCELYIFAVTPAEVRTEGAAKTHPHHNGTGAESLPAARGPAPPGRLSLDEVISIICSRTGIARTRLTSKSRAPEVSLARALVAYHGPQVSKASKAQVAAAMKMQANSMVAAIARSRKKAPDLFRAWDEFLASRRAGLSEPAANLKQGDGRGKNGAARDAELGRELARAFPPPEKAS